MAIYRVVFWSGTAFLSGILLASINRPLIAGIAIFSASGAIIYFFFRRNFLFGFLALGIIAGVFYYRAFERIQMNSVLIPFGTESEIRGLVIERELRPSSQRAVVELTDPWRGKIQITARRYPELNYGDIITAQGAIDPLVPERADYFLKNGIFGTMDFPDIAVSESGKGNAVKSALLNIKDMIVATFNKALPADKAALLSGITLGYRSDFSKELTEQMRLSGTTHLTALSGYNIMVIILAVTAVTGRYFSKNLSFLITAAAVVLFVIMAGAEASIVRAAIMGVIAAVGERLQRLRSADAAVMVTATAMVLFNPRLLVFDLGFQLSFLALLGIIYLKPALQNFFKSNQPGIWSWRENAFTTAAAQLAVAPLILGTFGTFSLTALFANVLVLEVIPITMALGFIIGGAGFLSQFLAGVAGLPASIFLGYALWVIGVFARFTLPITVTAMPIAFVFLYYALLAGFIRKYAKAAL